jgi:hypothetical protein
MNSDHAGEFHRLVAALLTRFFAQNGEPAPSEAARRQFAANLYQLIGERGLPRPLARHERGEPGEMSEAECAPLIARVLDGNIDPSLAEAARQLVKACFYPEFKTCRDSFREVSADGSCRRQDVVRARKRLSGSHCVDCPYWVALRPDQHEKFLARQWRAGEPEFHAHRAIFLPEDFRAVRQWLYAAACAK